MLPTECTCSHKCQDANVVAARSGGVLHNHPDARASYPDALQQLMKNCCLPSGRPMSCPDVAYENSSLSRIWISVAYLKRVIGCVFEKNLVLNSCVLREGV
jgi:hypothetical protein